MSKQRHLTNMHQKFQPNLQILEFFSKAKSLIELEYIGKYITAFAMLGTIKRTQS